MSEDKNEHSISFSDEQIRRMSNAISKINFSDLGYDFSSISAGITKIMKDNDIYAPENFYDISFSALINQNNIIEHINSINSIIYRHNKDSYDKMLRSVSNFYYYYKTPDFAHNTEDGSKKYLYFIFKLINEKDIHKIIENKWFPIVPENEKSEIITKNINSINIDKIMINSIKERMEDLIELEKDIFKKNNQYISDLIVSYKNNLHLGTSSLAYSVIELMFNHLIADTIKIENESIKFNKFKQTAVNEGKIKDVFNELGFNTKTKIIEKVAKTTDYYFRSSNEISSRNHISHGGIEMDEGVKSELFYSDEYREIINENHMYKILNIMFFYMDLFEQHRIINRYNSIKDML